MFTSGQGNTEVVCQFLDSSDYKYQPSQETSTGPMLTVCNTQRVCNCSDCDHQVFVCLVCEGADENSWQSRQRHAIYVQLLVDSPLPGRLQ
jgi:hypothetical protein